MSASPTGHQFCPFCGGPASLVTTGPTAEQASHARAWGEDYDVSYFVHCDRCGAATNDASCETIAWEHWDRRPVI